MPDIYTHPNGYTVSDTPHPGGPYVTGVDEATLTPPPREPQEGEVWRITLEDGSECNALVGVVPTGAPVIWRTAGGGVLLDTCPADRRLLVEADGTVISDE